MDVLLEIAVYIGFGIVFILFAALLVWAGALTVLLVRGRTWNEAASGATDAAGKTASALFRHFS